MLEYALNGDLFSFVKNTALSYDAKVFYIAQMVAILGYLREEGVVHRDLKPANFLIDEDWNLKIADFGSALTGVRSKLGLTKTMSASEFE